MHRPTQSSEASADAAPRLDASEILRPLTGDEEAVADEAYGPRFWLAYVANTLLMIAVSLLFRYGDFVTSLGGGERTLGLIVGTGMIGSLVMRLAQGVGIDRIGPRQIWLASLVGIIVTLLVHLLLTSSNTPTIYFVRILFQTSLAGAFGASITSITFRAPAARMAEMVGVLGSSGFLGMALGTQLGDLLTGVPAPGREQVARLFVAAAIIAGMSLVCTYFATLGEVRPPRRRWVPIVALVRRYHPGTMLLIGVAMGMGVNLPSTFLRPYTAHLGISKIGTYFGIYAATAFVARLATRRTSQRVGLKQTICWGMGALIVSMGLYLIVNSTWLLALPAIVAGIGHALLFPAVIAGATSTFPDRYRGLGVALVLGAFDIGNLIGMPLVGILLGAARDRGWPEYPTMFIVVAVLLSVATLIFILVPSRWQAAIERQQPAEPLRDVPDDGVGELLPDQAASAAGDYFISER